MIQNYFIEGSEGMWRICFREYDDNGNLTELISTKSQNIKSRWRTINQFLRSCRPPFTREVQFCRNGKQMPSLVSNGEHIRFEKPITALLPLFDYARNINVNV